MTVHDVSVNAEPPKAYRVIPDRIGRLKEFAPFEVRVDQSPREPADALARGIFNVARDHLMSREFEVRVDMDRGIFKIDGGRFGGGKFEAVVGSTGIG